MSGPDPELEEERRLEAGRWLAVALSDVRIAGVALELGPPLPGVAAYHCQQAAEKLMKGLLVLAGAPFTKTHDLEKIGALATEAWPKWTPLFAATGTWTVWGIAYRYPELEETPEPEIETLHQALQIIADLEAALRSLGASETPA